MDKVVSLVIGGLRDQSLDHHMLGPTDKLAKLRALLYLANPSNYLIESRWLGCWTDRLHERTGKVK